MMIRHYEHNCTVEGLCKQHSENSCERHGTLTQLTTEIASRFAMFALICGNKPNLCLVLHVNIFRRVTKSRKMSFVTSENTFILVSVTLFYLLAL